MSKSVLARPKPGFLSALIAKLPSRAKAAGNKGQASGHALVSDGLVFPKQLEMLPHDGVVEPELFKDWPAGAVLTRVGQKLHDDSTKFILAAVLVAPDVVWILDASGGADAAAVPRLRALLKPHFGTVEGPFGADISSVSALNVGKESRRNDAGKEIRTRGTLTAHRAFLLEVLLTAARLDVADVHFEVRGESPPGMDLNRVRMRIMGDVTELPQFRRPAEFMNLVISDL